MYADDDDDDDKDDEIHTKAVQPLQFPVSSSVINRSKH